MTFQPGDPRPPSAGRKPGTPNKETQALKELIDKLGCDPIEVLARVAMGDAIGLGLVPAGSQPGDSILALPISLRLKAASELAGYVYPKRKAVEISGESVSGGVMVVPAPMSTEEWVAKYGAIRPVNGDAKNVSTELTNPNGISALDLR